MCGFVQTRGQARSGQSGNIFIVLIGATILLGLLGATLTGTIKGPVTAVQYITQKSRVEMSLHNAAKLMIASTFDHQASGGDCDADSFIEPMPYRVAPSGVAVPVGGGLLPEGLASGTKDAWGSEIGYCVWDHGPQTMQAGCGGPAAQRLAGGNVITEIAVAFISAGPDRVFQTTCNAFIDTNGDGIPDTPLVQKGAGQDDIVIAQTYGESMVAGKIGAGASELTDLPDDACTPDNVGILRYSLGATQVCKADGWAEVGGAPEAADNYAEVVNASLDGVYTSNAIAFSSYYGTRMASVAGGATIILNGVDVGATAEIAAGDLVALRATAADTPEIKQDYVFSISTFTRPWSITTRDYTPPNFVISPSARSGMDITASATPSYGANVTFTVTNTGEVTSAAITAPSVSPDTNFQITATTCTGKAMVQDETCTVTVRPMAVANGNYSAVMTVTDGTATRTASVSGAASGFTVNCSESMVVGCVDTDGARYVGMNDDEPMFITATPEVNTYQQKINDVTTANATSEMDGRANTEAMIAASSASHPAAAACVAKGALWYLPALTELQQIIGHHATLKEQAADLGTTYIWSSTQIPGNGGGQLVSTGGSLVRSSTLAMKALCARKPEGPDECMQGISIGNGFSCGIGGDRKAYCWGRNNNYGQLGNGTTTNSSTPVLVSNGDNSAGTYTQISAGSTHVCALGTDEKAYCWGQGGNDQLGNGSSADRSVPTLVSNGANSAGTYKRLSAGSRLSTCGLGTDGKAYCWGYNSIGQLGNGNTTSQSTPVLVLNGANSTGTYTHIATGYQNACGIGMDGKAYCWGDNGYGQLGNGNTTNQSTPVLVLNGANSAGTYRQISPSINSSCGLGTDNKAYCWGHNASNQLGNGTTTNSSTPALVSNGANIAGTYIQIEAGYYTNCGIGTDGKGYCWGQNGQSQIGNGNTTQQSTPALVSSGANSASIYTQISTNYYATCGRGTNARIYCWGQNNYGQLGDGSTTNSNVPVLISNGENPNGKYCRPMASCVLGNGRTIFHGETITAYSAPAHMSCSTISQERTCTNGTLSGNAGFEYDACIGEFLESFENWASTAPVDWTDKSSSYMNRTQTSNLSHVTHGSKAMVLDGQEMADIADIWRPIDFTHYKSMSIDVTNFQAPYSQITVYPAATASGPSGTRIFNMPLTSTGKFEADISWITGLQYLSIGDGRQYQNLTVDNLRLKFADAEDNNRCLPGLSVGNEHSCALGTDGKAYCWGQGSSGQLGNGTTTGTQDVPVAVSNGANTSGTYKSLAGGFTHNCGIGNDDKAYCWGAGANGRLGNANTAQQNAPVAVSNGANTAGKYKEVQAGNAHSCGLGLDDKKVYCWGQGTSGQLGNNVATAQTSPVATVNGANATGGFKSVATSRGASHSCAIGLDDRAYCWGAGANGKLGNASTAQQNAPVLVSDGQNSLSTYKQVVVGTGYSCGIAADNKAYCWGINSYGQLGTGNTTQRTTAYLVVNGANTAGTYKTLSAGDNHTCGVGTDDKLYCWGYNNMSQLGNGNTTNQSSPILVSNGANTSGLWDQVSAGTIHTCGVGRDGKTYCWGHGGFGKTGQGDTSFYATPMLVQDGVNSGGDYRTCGDVVQLGVIVERDSFESWPSGASAAPEGWTFTPGPTGSSDISRTSSSLSVSNGVPVSHGTYSVKLYAEANASGGVIGASLTKTFDLTNKTGLGVTIPGVLPSESSWTIEIYAGTTRLYGPAAPGAGSIEVLLQPYALTGNHPIELRFRSNSSAYKLAQMLLDDFRLYASSGGEACVTGAIGTACSDGAIYIGTVASNRIYASAANSSTSAAFATGNTNTPTSTTDGLSNTATLMTKPGGFTYPAAVACKAHGAEWYLPARDEMTLIWANSTANGGPLDLSSMGISNGSWYWTSSQYTTGNTQAWIQHISSLNQIYDNKSYTGNVRCVRR